MKKSEGISLITLLITVIIIIIISSISIYNGANVLNDVKKKDAEDRLRVICNAIFKDDSFLSFNPDGLAELSSGDYDYMDLLKYYDEDNSVIVKKIESGDDEYKVVEYDLTMLENGTEYKYSASYTLSTPKYNYIVTFDESAGVNVPIVTENMKAIYKDGTLVGDIYKEDWYNYKEAKPYFARVKTEDNKIYVWIPRFAYNIQTFYEGRNSKDVPNTAISIVFLRETSTYMANDEVIPKKYKIHPAFTRDGVEYSGIWVEETAVSELSLLGAIFENHEDKYYAHMMTNHEYGAAIYLMYALGDMDELKLEKDEYVSACVTNGIDRFSPAGGFVTEYTKDASGDVLVEKSYGDAFYETPWDRTTGDFPTLDKPYVIRKFSNGIFDFTNSTGNDRAFYRRAIAIK